VADQGESDDMSRFTRRHTLIGAGALLGSIPVALVYSFFVEHHVSSLTDAVKE
jgi:ABC-type maltose transport system permease subunit